MNTRQVRAAHNRSFRNLHDVIEKKYGIPGDEVPYWDPYGHLTGGQPIDLKKSLYQKWKPAFEEMNEVMRLNPDASFAEVSKDVVQKNIGRGSFSIPIFFTPDVYTTTAQGEDTPLADMIPRVALNEDTVKADEQTDLGQASSFGEPSGAGETWPENDDAYGKYTYDVEAYGRQNEVTDFVQLAASGLRSTTALTEESQVAAIRQYEERQFLQGTGANLAGTTTGHDSSATAPVGLSDIVADPATQISDEAGSSITLAKVRNQIRKLRRDANANRGNIVHFTDHTTFGDLQSDLTDFTRYDSPGDSIDFGFQTIVADSTRIMETHGLPDTDGGRYFYSVDMSSIYAGMLQDVTMHPLARNNPAETFATDAYGTIAGESQHGIYILENLA